MAVDEACLLIAAHLDPPVDLGAERERLDQMAADVADRSVNGVLDHLFGRLGFRGDVDTYDDPRNSFLPRVVDRRMGIPITLSIMVRTVASRLGLELVWISMPGHFLLRERDDAEAYIDAFGGGVRLDRHGCERIYARIHGPNAAFADDLLAPRSDRTVVARVLANLRARYVATGDVAPLVEVLRLRCALPGTPVSERHELAVALARTSRFDTAAAELESLAGDASTADADRLRRRARSLRARLN